MNPKVDTDLLVIGGGISGAGVALAAARRGLRVTLVEREDFASGASSASSKLVHGGLRYLAQGAVHLTAQSLRERERLLRELPGLVQRLPFSLAAGGAASRAGTALGLRLYDALARRHARGFDDAATLAWTVPGWHAPQGAHRYDDATTDDARLTLRVLQEARTWGAQLHNRTALEALTRDAQGQVNGAQLRGPGGQPWTLRCLAAVAATGAHLATLADQIGLKTPKLRPLRGSHLLLPLWRLPLARAVAWRHARDGRPVFAYPWLGTLIVGTTDEDHPDPERAPRITAAEQAYLLDALAQAFPRAGIQARDLQCTWAGLRPVLDSGQGLAPSQERRDTLVQASQGLVLLSGGKLTTFIPMAEAALRAAAPWLPLLREPAHAAWFAGGGTPLPLEAMTGERLGGTQTRMGEIAWSLQHEQVHHLDDLLLRRTRFGLRQPDFAQALLPALQTPCQSALGWDGTRWRFEVERYLALMHERHGVVGPERRAAPKPGPIPSGDRPVHAGEGRTAS